MNNNKYKSTATYLDSFPDNPSGMPRPRFYADTHEHPSYHNTIDGFENAKFACPESVDKGGDADRGINNSNQWQPRLSGSIQHPSLGYYSPYGFNPHMDGTSSTSTQNQYGYSYDFQPPHHSYIYGVPYGHHAPSTSQRNPTARNSRSSEPFIVSHPSPLIKVSGSHVLDDPEALNSVQDNNSALTSGTWPSGGGPIYTPESPTRVIDRTSPRVGRASSPSPAAPMLRGVGLPSGTIEDFPPLDGLSSTTSQPRGDGGSIRYDGVSHQSISSSYSRSNDAIATPSIHHVNDISGPFLDKWRSSARQAQILQQSQTLEVDEKIYCPAGFPVPYQAPVEASDRSSSETVMPDEELPIRRQAPPATASTQNDKEMSEGGSMSGSQSSSVMTEITTGQLAQPLNTSIASKVDVGNPIREAFRPAATTQTQAQAPTPTPTKGAVTFTERALHALTFEPCTNPIGKKFYEWSNDPGWPVAVESLPAIGAGNCLHRLMGDHALGEAIAQAMHETIGGADEEWVVRAVFGFGDGAMVLVRKV